MLFNVQIFYLGMFHILLLLKIFKLQMFGVKMGFLFVYFLTFGSYLLIHFDFKHFMVYLLLYSCYDSLPIFSI